MASCRLDGIEPRSTRSPLHKAPLKYARPSIAVLPFGNMSAERADDYPSDAIAENIISALSHFRELSIIASHSVFAYKSKRGRIPEIARELGARFVLESSVQKSNDRVTITAQLIDGPTGAHLGLNASIDLTATCSPFFIKSLNRSSVDWVHPIAVAWARLGAGRSTAIPPGGRGPITSILRQAMLPSTT